jgi:prohibitin 2
MPRIEPPPPDTSALILRTIVWVVAGILLFSLVWGSFFVVHPGERALVFNSVSGLREGTYYEGMHIKIPIIETAIPMNIRVQKQEEEAHAASKDLQDVSTVVAVNYQIDQTELQVVYRTIGQSTPDDDYMQTEIMNPIIQESVKAVTAQYTADQLITNRQQVKQAIDDLIKQRLEHYHITVLDVSITNFRFSDVFTEAIEAKVTAEQDALREENNLAVVKFQAQQKIEIARGDAEAIRIINEELRQSPAYVSYLTIQKWDGKMPLSLGSGSLLSIVPQ